MSKRTQNKKFALMNNQLNELDFETSKVVASYSIVSTSNFLHESKKIHNKTIDNIFNEIQEYQKYTGIMIGSFEITEDAYLYFFIFDNQIIIFDKTILNSLYLPKIQRFLFKHCKNTNFYFSDYQSTEIIEAIKQNKNNDEICYMQNKQTVNIPKLMKEISRSILRKKFIRTINKRLKIQSNKIIISKMNFSDFILTKTITSNVNLYINVKDNFLYLLKEFDIASKQYNHEISFYKLINNEHPFISKCYGETETIKESESINKRYIVIEYIKGKSLNDFMISNRNLPITLKIYIIFSLLIAIEYVHSKNIILRDLKPDNIIIDANYHSILIDFDKTKIINSKEQIDDDEMTCDIGSSYYASPQQYASNEYSQKADIYSLGMIIHYIITGEKYNFNPDDIQRKLNEQKENISNLNEFPKCPPIYNDLYEFYKKCLEFSPEKRPNIKDVINSFLVIIINTLSTKHYISSEELIEYLNILANQSDSNAQCYLGEVYYNDKFELFDINLSIHYLTLSASQNNSEAQYFLGKIYLDGKHFPIDINMAIYYFECAANNNNSEAQCILGTIFSTGDYVLINYDKSIHYLTLSANQNNRNAQSLLGALYCTIDILYDINKAIYYLTLSANQNDLEAQYLLGKIYLSNKYISTDINKAIYYLTLSANQNNSNAQCLLGKIYLSNKYISTDINKAIYYLTLSANQNNSNAQLMLGLIYYEGKQYPIDIDKSIYYLTLSAKQNNSNAQFILGVIYYEGKQCPIDIYKSIYYLTLSAKQNNSSAQCILGIIYSNRKQTDTKKSIQYLELSANQNDESAQCILGQMYIFGENVPQDIQKGMKYLNFSANKNNSTAQLQLGILYYEGKFVQKDINKAINYLIRSSNNNNINAQYILGYIYSTDKYIQQNIEKAVYYLTLAADQNHSDAQYILGAIYYSGEYVPKNIKKSIHYFKEASCYYHNMAKNNLGVIYKNGDGVDKNIYFAIEYFKEAIRKNDSYSRYNLSRIFYFGIEIDQNIEESIRIIEPAACERFGPAILFLYFIYLYGYKSSIDIQKASYYRDLLYKNYDYELLIKSLMAITCNKNDIDMIFKQRIFDFFKHYDLEYVSNKNFLNDFCIYMASGAFKTRNDFYNSEKLLEKIRCRKLDKSFYEGFNIKI